MNIAERLKNMNIHINMSERSTRQGNSKLNHVVIDI